MSKNGLFQKSVSRRGFLQVSLGAASGLVVLGGLAACGSEEGATGSGGKDLGDFNFQLGWYPNSEYCGQIVALQKGYYKKAGLDFKIHPGGPNAVIDPLLASGERDGASTATDKIATAYKNEFDNFRIVGANYQVTSSCVVSMANNPINEPEDMVGKRFGVSQTDLPVYDAFFKFVGIDTSKIEYVPSASDSSMLIAGEIDAISSTLPNEPVNLRTKGHDVVALGLGDYGYMRWSGANYVRQEDLDDPDARKVIKAYLAATIRGYKDALNDPNEAAQIVVDLYGDEYGYSLEQMTESSRQWVQLLTTPDTEKHGLMRMTEEGIASQGEFLELVGIDVDANELFDPTVLNEVYEEESDLL